MSSLTTASYELARPTGVCAATGRAIPTGERFVATLVERDGRLERADYSVEAWERGERPGSLIGSWRTAMPAPNAKARLFVDDDALLDLFEQMEGATEPTRVAFRFILALILIRKRLLRYEGKRDGAMLVRAAGRPGQGPDPRVSSVVEPKLDDATIAEATEQLSEIVRGDEGAG